MKKIVAVIAALFALTGIAAAADLPAKAPVYKAPIAVAYNWTGFYVGINGGGGWGSSNWDGLPTGTFNTSGGVIGGTIGYNLQNGPIVWGIEGDLDWASISGSSNTPAALCTAPCTTKTDWLGTVRGRVGYAFDRILPYVTGGLAVGDIKASQTGFAGQTTTKAGWTLGGGAEFAIAGPWTAKVEYLYVGLGSTSCAAGICDQLATNVNHNINLVRGGINYRF
jgi:outer membrane immunogenic protein